MSEINLGKLDGLDEYIEKQYMLTDFDSEVEMLEKINEQQATIKQQAIRIHCQDQEIQRLLNKIQEME